MKTKKQIIQLILLALTLTSFTNRGWATSHTVTSTTDSGTGSLREAISNATNGDTIKFSSNINGSQIVLATQLNINKQLVLIGNNPTNTIISGNDVTRILFVTDTLHVTGINFQHGNYPINNSVTGGAVGVANTGQLYADDCSFEDNLAVYGAGIHCYYGADAYISNSSFKRNTATGTSTNAGGALSVTLGTNSEVTLNNCEFIDNVYNQNDANSRAGAAIYGYGGKFEINNCLFDQNSVTASTNSYANGGAIYIREFGAFEAEISIDRCKFTNNSVLSTGTNQGARGGAIYMDGSINLQLSNSTFKNNSSTGNNGNAYGGAISLKSDSAWIDNCYFYNNSAWGKNTTNASYGGAVHCNTYFNEIKNSTFENNSVLAQNAASLGGGLHTTTKGNYLLMENSTFYNNSSTSQISTAYGGGISDHSYITTFINNTIIGNSSTSPGYNSSGGLGLFRSFNTRSLHNNIIYNNTTSSGTNMDIYWESCTNYTVTQNLVGTIPAGFQSGFTYNSDPGLDPTGIQDNGGTVPTLAIISPSSDAVNNANISFAPNLDQRGAVRSGNPDLGAYEFGACATFYSEIQINSCDSYTVPSGDETHSITGVYMDTLTGIGGCDSILTINLTIQSITNQSITNASQNICDGESTTISTSSSENGLNYYLRENTNNTIIDGPIAGTGSTLSFTTGSLSNTTNYNVYAETVPFSSALSFDGTDDYVSIPHSSTLDVTSAVTVEAWIKADNISSGYKVVGKCQNGSAQNGFGMGIRNGRLDSEYYTTSGSDTEESAAAIIIPGQWMHVAMTRTSTGNKRIYLDGVLISSSPSNGSDLGVNTNNMHIGIAPYNTTQYHFPGEIDEVRVWNVERTPTEIANNMNTCLNGNETGLVALYHFNEGSGSAIVSDATNQIADGTLNNMDPATDWTSRMDACGLICTKEMTQIATVNVNSPVTYTQNFEECVGFSITVGNNSYNTTGVYTDILTASNGCDSTVTTNLNILSTSSGAITESFCNSYTVPSGDETYTMSGVYYDTLINAVGCDSIITINLTIHSILDQPVTAQQNIICNGDSTYVSINSSETGIQYFLRNDMNDSVVSGPFDGNGSSITLPTGQLNTTSNYNVYAATSSTSLDFDGTNDYAETSSTVNLANHSFTIEAWAKRSTTGSFDYFICQGTNSTNNGLHFGFKAHGAFAFAFWANDLLTPTTYLDFDWHHWAATYDAITNERKIYRDGILVANDIANSAYTGTGNLLIGQRFIGDHYTGKIDEVRIWDEARTQAEINANMYVCLNGNEANLMAYYDFEDGTGSSVITDKTGNYNANMINMDSNSDWTTGIGVCGTCTLEMSQIATINVISPIINNQTFVECDGFSVQVGSNSYNTSGIYTDTLTNVNGCDSTVITNLTINYPSSGTDVITACKSYTWIDGIEYTNSNNTATYTLANTSGCDSIVTLDLTIHNVNISTTTSLETITAIVTGADYQWIDCNNSNTNIMGETGQSFTATVNGNYAVIINDGTCTDTSSCTSIQSTGIESDIKSFETTLYPNPNNGIFTLNFESVNSGAITIVSLDGKIVHQSTFENNDHSQLYMQKLEKGTYQVIVTFSNNYRVIKQLVII